MLQTPVKTICPDMRVCGFVFFNTINADKSHFTGQYPVGPNSTFDSSLNSNLQCKQINIKAQKRRAKAEITLI